MREKFWQTLDQDGFITFGEQANELKQFNHSGKFLTSFSAFSFSSVTLICHSSWLLLIPPLLIPPLALKMQIAILFWNPVSLKQNLHEVNYSNYGHM